ncbi:MAG: DUF6484 domain-containing protein [Myxococcota bacterium]
MAKQAQHVLGSDGCSDGCSEGTTGAPTGGSVEVTKDIPIPRRDEAQQEQHVRGVDGVLGGSVEVTKDIPIPQHGRAAEARGSGQSEQPECPPPAMGEVMAGPGFGELLGFSELGYPVVSLSSNEALEVPSTVELTREDVGHMFLVSYVDGCADQPIITGRLLPPRILPRILEDEAQSTADASGQEASAAKVLGEGPITVESDGETIAIEAKRELVLRCGEASIRLRRDGRVEVRGIDVVSRAKRANWIKGGSVALN